MGELCARFEVNQPDAPGGKGVIYVKSRWFATTFSLWVTDGVNAWSGHGLEEEVSRRAFSWDCTVSDYLQSAEKYLGFQDPNSNYSFVSQGDETRKLSWTLERDGVQLVANWRVEKSLTPKDITCDILGFLMKGCSRLSEELQRKRRSFEQMKTEADRCLAQSLRFRDEKIQFEDVIFRKFVAVLNSKKDKIRYLKEQVLRSEASTGKNVKEGETESEDELEETDHEADGEEDLREEKSKEASEKDADEDSGATEILPDSPVADIHSMDPDPCHLPAHNLNLNATFAETSSFNHPTEAVADAATLLSGTSYTSAPRKRRHQ